MTARLVFSKVHIHCKKRLAIFPAGDGKIANLFLQCRSRIRLMAPHPSGDHSLSNSDGDQSRGPHYKGAFRLPKESQKYSRFHTTVFSGSLIVF